MPPIVAPMDYRAVARRRLPRFLFDYLDHGAWDEVTLRHNTADLQAVGLRQRVLRNVAGRHTTTRLFDEDFALPLALAPVGMAGMYARRGEVQAARAAARFGVSATLSTVSVCAIEEVAAAIDRPLWFQLYVMKDRGFMRSALERALAAGVSTLVFTVDLAATGMRYTDVRSGLAGPHAKRRQWCQALAHPRWAWDVGVRGRPHSMGNLSAYLGEAKGLDTYADWLESNFDPSVSLPDLDWIREFWPRRLLVKGVLDADDARDVLRFGADGIVVSNHGGRQLDGVPSTARALPRIAAVVGGKIPLLVDSGVRSGLDIARMLALGADLVLLGRPYVYALAAAGETGVAQVLTMLRNELEIAMALLGVNSVEEIDGSCLLETERQA